MGGEMESIWRAMFVGATEKEEARAVLMVKVEQVSKSASKVSK